MTERYKIGDIDNERFYQIPKSLFTNPKYKPMTTTAKIVYAILKDRMELSRRNGWNDENGDIYLLFSQESLAEYLGVTPKTVQRGMKELAEAGLIDSVRQGLGHPNKIYINKPIYQQEQSRMSNQDRTFLSNQDRTFLSGQSGHFCPPNDTEKNDTEKNDKNILSGKPDCALIAGIVEYLNQQTGKHYKSDTPKTKRLINARLNEGFSVEDFKAVICKKSREWGKDAHMERYLRPETLFGTKFEGYLNEKEKNNNDNIQGAYGESQPKPQNNAGAEWDEQLRNWCARQKSEPRPWDV